MDATVLTNTMREASLGTRVGAEFPSGAHLYAVIPAPGENGELRNVSHTIQVDSFLIRRSDAEHRRVGWIESRRWQL